MARIVWQSVSEGVFEVEADTLVDAHLEMERLVGLVCPWRLYKGKPPEPKGEEETDE